MATVRANKIDPVDWDPFQVLRRSSATVVGWDDSCGKDRKACRDVVDAANDAERNRNPASRNPAWEVDEADVVAVVVAVAVVAWQDDENAMVTPWWNNNPQDWRVRLVRPHFLCLWPPPDQQHASTVLERGSKVHSSVKNVVNK